MKVKSIALVCASLISAFSHAQQLELTTSEKHPRLSPDGGSLSYTAQIINTGPGDLNLEYYTNLIFPNGHQYNLTLPTPITLSAGLNQSITGHEITLPGNYPAGRYKLQFTTVNKDSFLFNIKSFDFDKDIDLKIFNYKGYVCGIQHNGGIGCWGYIKSWELGVQNKPITQSLSLETPTPGTADSFFVDELGFCHWNNNTLACEDGLPKELAESAPTLNAPRVFAYSHGGLVEACAIDNSPQQVKCWGNQAWIIEQNAPDFGTGHATELVLGNEFACALLEGVTGTNNKVKCWANSQSVEHEQAMAELFSGMENPTAIYAYNENICALDGGKAQCFKLSSDRIKALPLPALNGISDIKIGDDRTIGTDYAQALCATHSEGAGCWSLEDGTQIDITQTAALSNPTQVVINWDYKCAVDDYGVSCWGPGYEQSLKNLTSWDVDLSYTNHFWVASPESFSLLRPE